MAQIDRLLLPLASGDHGTLYLAEGKAATIEQGDASREVTRFPVDGPAVDGDPPRGRTTARGRQAHSRRTGGLHLPLRRRPLSRQGIARQRWVVGHRRPGGRCPLRRRRDRRDVARVQARAEHRRPADAWPSSAAPRTCICAAASRPSCARRRHRAGRRPVLDGSEIRTMIDATIPARNRAEFDLQATPTTRTRCPTRALPRQRLHDRRGPAVVFRQIPRDVRSVEEMGLPPEVQQLALLRSGLVLVTGPTGSGKSTTLGALIDLVNGSRRSRHHDRGPDRVRAPEQELHHHAAPGRRAHRVVQERAARRAARGPGRRSSSASCATSRPSRSRSRRRRRGTSSSARCTRRPRPARSTASSTSSRPTGRSRSA